MALLLGCALVDPGAPGPSRGVAKTLEGAFVAPPGGPWLCAVARAHRIIVAGLAGALFLGGWSLPGLSPAQQEALPVLQAVGAACWLAKTAALGVGLSLARCGFGRASQGARSRATVTWVAPLSLVAFGTTAAWMWWSPGPAAQLLVSAALVTLAALWSLAMLQRFKHGVAAPDAHLSPFL